MTNKLMLQIENILILGSNFHMNRIENTYFTFPGREILLRTLKVTNKFTYRNKHRCTTHQCMPNKQTFFGAWINNNNYHTEQNSMLTLAKSGIKFAFYLIDYNRKTKTGIMFS